MKRWDFKTRKYTDYEVPDDWYTPLIEIDMETFVNCASCGLEVMVGLMYTSWQIHSDQGLGYLVCEGCARDESEAKRAAREER